MSKRELQSADITYRRCPSPCKLPLHERQASFRLPGPNYEDRSAAMCVSLKPVVLSSARTHLLVWLILALRVSNLCHKVILLLEYEVLNCRFSHDQLALAAGSSSLRTRIPTRYAH